MYAHRRAHVLLVEDDVPTQRTYQYQLVEQCGVTCLTAGDGAEALQKLQNHPEVQILVTDWLMPVMDGLELCRQARALVRPHYLYIIVLTAKTAKDDLLAAMAAGADAFLSKPVDGRELQAQLHAARRVIAREQELAHQSERRTIMNSFVESGDIRRASHEMLRLALRDTQSQYGFIGATVTGGPHGETLRIFSDQGFEWSPTDNRVLYEEIMADYETRGYLDFPRLDNLFGWAILHAEPVLTNDPGHDSRARLRMPAGHPPLNSFLGLPILKEDSVVDMIGVANRPGGYQPHHLEPLQKLSRVAGIIYEGYRRRQREHSLVQEHLQAQKALHAANQSLLELAYVVSHELQEPLNIVRSQLRLLNARYRERLGPDADDFMSMALAEVSVIARMVDDLWEYARIERPHIQFEPIDMNVLFKEVVQAITSTRSYPSDAVITADEELPEIHGERREIGVVLHQLLLNALQFNRAKPPLVHLSAQMLVNEWLFCMSDNGIGFPQVDAPEIFKMFRKLDRNSPVTGMGLAICKRIIEFHGGSMRAESIPGGGSRLYFSIPIVPNRPPTRV